MPDNVMTGLTGRRTVQDGNFTNLRLEKDCSAAMFSAHADYFDSVRRGNVFSAGTAASGVAPGTSIGTTAAFSLYNPLGSGVNLVVVRTTVGYVSGTLGAGVIHYVANINPAAAATTGTAITPVNCYIGVGINTSQARPLTTATLPASPTIVRPFCSLQASLASTAVGPWQVMEDVRGEFVIAPGCTLSLECTTAAGSSPLLVFGMTWEEFPA